jgi:hypothetical protein
LDHLGKNRQAVTNWGLFDYRPDKVGKELDVFVTGGTGKFSLSRWLASEARLAEGLNQLERAQTAKICLP